MDGSILAKATSARHVMNMYLFRRTQYLSRSATAAFIIKLLKSLQHARRDLVAASDGAPGDVDSWGMVPPTGVEAEATAVESAAGGQASLLEV